MQHFISALFTKPLDSAVYYTEDQHSRIINRALDCRIQFFFFLSSCIATYKIKLMDDFKCAVYMAWDYTITTYQWYFSALVSQRTRQVEIDGLFPMTVNTQMNEGV